jgi:hypothetical protein
VQGTPQPQNRLKKPCAVWHFDWSVKGQRDFAPGGNGTMTKFFAGLLTVIAVGVLLIAYGLLKPAAAFSPTVAPVGTVMPGAPMMVIDEYGRQLLVTAPLAQAPMRIPTTSAAAGPVRTTVTTAAPRATAQAVPRRDWRKTALLIGGSTAAGAGVGGIFGGKKGALIGAAIGGGASTIYESAK